MRVKSATLHSEINVTPLVDVCLVLLIIFMVVTPMMVNGMPVQLPRSGSGENIRHQPLQVTINADRILYVGTAAIRMEQLSGELQRVRAESNRPVIVRADKSLSYGDVVAVLDACRTAGFDQVALGTEKK
ncbi:MAG TPA: biopolymer transporter ExbD [Thermoanaerobaculia bacterium]|nr:biopolymer transporter ExbD [Thermoanaerobaculia bacterium]